MKKILISLLALVLIVGLFAACGNGTPSPTPAPPPAETPGGEPAPPPEPTIDFPTGEITFMVPNAAGGGNDLGTRALIPGLIEYLGVNVVPINRSEAGGAVASQEVANATPDGYTILFYSPTLILLSHSVDEIRTENFQPVAKVAQDTALIYVGADAPWQTIEELIEAAQTQTIRVAHIGTGTMWHVAALQFMNAIGADFQFVPYTDGGVAALTAVAAGEVDMTIVAFSEGRGLLDGGLVRALAVAGDTRLDVLPDVPTVLETGYNFSFTVWRMIFTAAGTDPAILEIYDRAFEAAVNGPAFQEFAESFALTPYFMGHQEATRFFEQQAALYAEILAQIG